jgi:hypothetical protein
MKNFKANALIGASWMAFAGVAMAQTPPDAREARIRELEARVAQIESELRQLREDETAQATAATPAPTPPARQPTVTVANGRPPFLRNAKRRREAAPGVQNARTQRLVSTSSR